MQNTLVCLLLLFLGLQAGAFPGGELNKDSTARQISIMSYNIKMLPRGAVFLHHHPVARAKLIPEKLLAEGTDLIVFEESFDTKAVRILKKGLAAMYPYSMGFQNRRLMTYKRAGGVLIFSKYPMHEIESTAYSECKGADCMGHKGLF